VHPGQDPFKSHNAIEELRRQAHFSPKNVDEPLLAEAGLPSQLTRPRSASSLSKPIQRQSYGTMMLLLIREARHEQLL
jgi:hypothetical protein